MDTLAHQEMVPAFEVIHGSCFSMMRARACLCKVGGGCSEQAGFGIFCRCLRCGRLELCQKLHHQLKATWRQMRVQQQLVSQQIPATQSKLSMASRRDVDHFVTVHGKLVMFDRDDASSCCNTLACPDLKFLQGRIPHIFLSYKQQRAQLTIHFRNICR